MLPHPAQAAPLCPHCSSCRCRCIQGVGGGAPGATAVAGAGQLGKAGSCFWARLHWFFALRLRDDATSGCKKGVRPALRDRRTWHRRWWGGGRLLAFTWRSPASVQMSLRRAREDRGTCPGCPAAPPGCTWAGTSGRRVAVWGTRSLVALGDPGEAGRWTEIRCGAHVCERVSSQKVTPTLALQTCHLLSTGFHRAT